LDPDENEAIRKTYWAASMEGMLLPKKRTRQFEGELEMGDWKRIVRAVHGASGSAPVVIWVDNSWPGILSSWWLAYGLRGLHVPRTRVLTAGGLESSTCFDRDLLDNQFKMRGRLTGVRRVPARVLNKWSALWMDYCRDSPGRMMRRLAQMEETEAAYVRAVEVYAKSLPRLDDGAILRISEIDQGLLRGLRVGEWRNLVDVIR
jgi:hypothetical protein